MIFAVFACLLCVTAGLELYPKSLDWMPLQEAIQKAMCVADQVKLRQDPVNSMEFLREGHHYVPRDVSWIQYHYHVNPDWMYSNGVYHTIGYYPINCSESAIPFIEFRDIIPEIFCMEPSGLLTLEWNVEDDLENATFFVQFEEQITKKVGVYNYFSMFNSMTIKDLSPNTSYDVTVWAVLPGNMVFQPINAITITTHPNDFDPLPGFKILHTDIIPSVDSCNVSVWFAASKEDPSCYYFAAYYSSSYLSDVEEITIDRVPNQFQLFLPNLPFSENYTLELMSINKDSTIPYAESEKLIHYIVLPSCLVANNYNLSFCAPDMPENLTVTEVLSQIVENVTFYDLHVTWTEPLAVPHYYILNVIAIYYDHAYTYNISGNATHFDVKDVPLLGMYEVTLKGFSVVKGPGKGTVYRNILEPVVLHKTSNTMVFVILAAVLSFTLVIGLAILLGRRYMSLCKEELTFDKNFSIKTEYLKPELKEGHVIVFEPDEWELDSNKVVACEVLGEGAFGMVRKGFLLNEKKENISVAIKTLKENSTLEEIKQFQQEIEIMKSVGFNQNIVSLIGCITNSTNGPALVVEYCPKGNLLNFLREEWEKLSSLMNCTNKKFYENIPKSEETNISNKLYQIEIITPKDLLSIARQVALGMEFLANVKVIHRDLAARNVLVCSDMVVKVSDFGLSRDVYLDSVYCKTSKGKLPVKWTAIESLMHQQYTTQSDVWSFGILLWEIVTLGQHPYPGINTGDLLKMLVGGYRMERPNSCGEELYSLMLECWEENPKLRPSFSDIKAKLESFLEDDCIYLNLKSKSDC